MLEFEEGFHLAEALRLYAEIGGYSPALPLIGIEDSRHQLEQIAGVTVHTLAYPFGRYGPAAVAAARDAGLLAAVTTGSGSWQPYELTRAMIGALDPLPVIYLKLTDRYEPLLHPPPMRALRQASRGVRELARSRRGGR